MKLAIYSFLAHIPFYRKTAQKKVKKYEQRKNNQIIEKQKYFELNLCRYAERLNFLSNSKKKKIIIIGSFYKNCPVNFYSNIILKNLEYKDSIVDFYDIEEQCLINFSNEHFLQNRNTLDIKLYLSLENLDLSQYDSGIFITDFSKKIKFRSNPKIFFLYCTSSHNYSSDKLSSYVNMTFDAVFIPNEMGKISLDDIAIPVIPLPVLLNMKGYKYIKPHPTKDILYFGDIGECYDMARNLRPLSKYLEKQEAKLHIRYRSGNELYLGITPYKDDLKSKLFSLMSDKNISIEKAEQLQFMSETKRHISLNSAVIYDGKSISFMNNPFQALAAGRQVFAPEWFSFASTVPGVHIYHSKEELLEQIKEYLDSKDEGFDARKNFATLFTKQETIPGYPFLTDFSHIKQTDSENTFYKDGNLLVNDNGFYRKCNDFLYKNKIKTPVKIIIVPANDAGFFSIYNKQASFLTYAKPDEAYIPDWRCSSVLRNIYDAYGAEQLNSFCYASRKDGNIFLKLFECPYPEKIFAKDLYDSDSMYTYADNAIHICEYNFDNEPDLTYIYASDLTKDTEYFSDFRKRYHKTITEKMRPLPHIMKQIDDFKEKNLKGHFSISVHIRCAAHSIETRKDIMFKDFDKKIEEILKTEKVDTLSGDWKLFIATDNDIALEYYRKKYPGHAVWQDGISRLTAEQEKEYAAVKAKAKKDIDGYELQQRRSKSESSRSLKLAVDVLTDAYLLASCSYFVYQSSNVSTAVSYINPDIKMIYAESDE